MSCVCGVDIVRWLIHIASENKKLLHAPRVLDHRRLHAQADAEEGDAPLAGPPDGAHLAVQPARAEAAGHLFLHFVL